MRNLIIIITLLLFSSVTITARELFSGQQVSINDTSTPYSYIEPELVGISSDSLSLITNQIEDWLNAGEIVGGEVLIIKNRQTILHEVFGYRNREENVLWEKNTICRIRSMTKPFVGTSVLMLYENDSISLNDKVSEYVPAFNNPQSRDITIYHLLTHTSGINNPGFTGSA